MFTITIIALILLATFLIAGLPLVAIPRVRAAVQIAGGSCCISGGAGVMGLLAAGLIAWPGPAAAQEKPADPAAAAADTKDDSKPTETKPTEPAASQQPAIDLDADSAAKPADDIKIESLPGRKIEIPPGRPEWINRDKKTNFSGDVHTIYVTSGPHKELRDAQRGLEEALKRATNEYVGDQLGSPLAAQFVSYDLRTIQQRFAKKTYNETVTFADPLLGPMEQSHALLEFDEPFRKELHRTWAGQVSQNRLYQVGLFGGAALLFLSSVFGYFRLDNATRGYYTGRLQFMTAAAILAIVALVAVGAFQIAWL